MNTDQMKKKIIFKDESSYSVQESSVTGKACDTCRFFFTASFPDMPPCKDCNRCGNWKSRIEEVKLGERHCSDCKYRYINDVPTSRCQNPEACFNFSQFQLHIGTEPEDVKATHERIQAVATKALLGRLPDLINHPPHYTSHPSGIECIQITEHMSFNLGNVIKYTWRADLKEKKIEDLKKAKWYLERELSKLEGDGEK